jgi:hypothetical protein
VQLYRRNKTITAPRQSLNEARGFRRVSQYLTNLVNRCVEVVIDIDKGVWPQPFLQILPGHNFAGTLQQNSQDLERLTGKFELDSTFAQLPYPKVDFEGSESD